MSDWSENSYEKTSTGDSQSKVVQSGDQNVLHKYRSFTYNFTLAALKKIDVNDPEKYRQSALDLVILRSGGKGTSGISENVVGLDIYKEFDVKEYVTGPDGNLEENIRKEKRVADVDVETGKQLVSRFNKDSPGQFDMFIDDVEIETLMAFSEEGGATQPTRIKFNVIEPYSVNGFIEALQVSAVAAGYPNYASASFILKMDFIGYPDGEGMPPPQKEDEATRYFVLGFTGLEVEITEKGTKYNCSAVPFNEKGFGQPNQLKKPIQIFGKNVAQILQNLMEGVNKQVGESNKDGRTKTSTKQDRYYITFPEWDDKLGFVTDKEKINKIGQAQITELLKKSATYTFTDPSKINNDVYSSKQSSGTETVRLDSVSAQFNENLNIHECISSIIRDSEYVKNILKTLGTEGNPDRYGMIDYFLVKLEVTNQNEIDEISKKPYQNFTFVVTPFKIHYTKIPSYGSNQKIDPSKLELLSLREYNYIYTGKNTDILNFRLNFNTLFFEAISQSFGNNDFPGSRNAAARSNSVEPSLSFDSSTGSTSAPMAGAKTDAILHETHVGGTPNAGAKQDDPYDLLAKGMHQALIDSKASMIHGEIEILGDPFFLVTGGIGNFNPKPLRRGLVEGGEAAYNQGNVLITVNFRNPVDINPLSKGGLMFFDKKKVAFSGIYQVLKAVSTFREGNFKQKLEIVRIPGQIDDNTQPSNPADQVTNEPDKQDQVIPAVTQAQDAAIISANATLADILTRDVPNPRLSSLVSSITGAASGTISSTLGGVSSVVSTVANPLSKFGINAEQLMQLPSVDQTALLTKATQLAKIIPSNTDLTQLADQGLIFDKIPTENLKNLPATPPFITAPNAAIVDNIIDSNSSFSNPLASVSKSAANIVTQASTPFASSLGNVNVASLGTSVSEKFGSVTQVSPLTKVLVQLNNGN